MIIWNKVTWYSQLTAIILGIVIFYAGFYIGNENYTHISLDEGSVENELPLTTTVRLGYDGGEFKYVTSETLNTLDPGSSIFALGGRKNHDSAYHNDTQVKQLA